MTASTNQSETIETGPASAQAPGFEAAINELEALTNRMAAGDLSLEESISMYKRGVELARTCQQTLEAAEQQVKVLQDQLLQPLNPEDLRDNS